MLNKHVVPWLPTGLAAMIGWALETFGPTDQSWGPYVWALVAAVALITLITRPFAQAHLIWLRKRVGSVGSFLLVSVAAGLLVGFVFLWFSRQDTTKPPVEASGGVSGAERQARHALRNEIADLMSTGQILRGNILAVSENRMPALEARVPQLLMSVGEWHGKVLNLVASKFGTAEAIRVSAAATVDHTYPPNLVQTLPKTNEGFDLRGAWGWIVGDLAALDRLLSENPELR